MISRVFIKKLTIPFYIGVSEKERNEKTDLHFAVSLEINFSRAAGLDDIGFTYDYSKIENILQELANIGPFKLLEKVAFLLSEKIFEDNNVVSVEISIEKENPYKMLPCTAGVFLKRFGNEKKMARGKPKPSPLISF